MIGRLLDRSPLWIILLIAIMLGLAPIGSTPHLVEKIALVLNGSLSKGIDLFDLFLHSSGILILLLKINRMLRQSDAFNVSGAGDNDINKESKDDEYKG